MCSNTGSTACGCGGSGGGNGGGGGGATMWSSSLKKQQQQQQQKRPRVPKRGPGVAELEKILREQEITTIDNKDKGNGNGNQGFPSSCFLPHHSTSHSFSSPSFKSTPPGPASSNFPPPHVVPSLPKFDHLGPITPPTMASIYGNGGPSGRINGGGSGLVVSPGQELFPMNLSSCRSMPNLNESVEGSQSDSANSPSRNESNPVWPFSAKRNSHYPPPTPTMNQFLGNGTRPSSGSLPIGLNNHIEPPSNQSSYYNYTSRTQEEHMMVGLKRSHSSPLDNSLIPPSNFQVLPSFSHCNKPHHSSTNGTSHGAGDFNSTESYSDKKWGSSLELSNRRFNSDIARPGHANFPPFAAPEVTPPPPPPVHLFQSVLNKGNVLPCHITDDKMEDSYQPPESRVPDHKPFYDFLQVKGPEDATETTDGPNHGGRDAGRGGIDLNLTL